MIFVHINLQWGQQLLSSMCWFRDLGSFQFIVLSWLRVCIQQGEKEYGEVLPISQKNTVPWIKVIAFPHLPAREVGKYGVSLASHYLATLNNTGEQVFWGQLFVDITDIHWNVKSVLYFLLKY